MSNNNALTNRMKELVELLNEAGKAYYANDAEIMSNYEYDKLYDELEQLERETGTVLANSPTVNVGYEAVDELPKERHASPMLSLGKTKEREELVSWLNGKEGILSWKLDGLTIVLTYRDGKLFKAVTRGNGEIGEVVTNNAKTFVNLPLTIPFKGELVLRGEAVIKYSDFEKINSEIEDVEAKYKNPRNLCSGSVRQLNNEVTAKRKVNFMAFSLVSARETISEHTKNVTKHAEATTEQAENVTKHTEATTEQEENVTKHTEATTEQAETVTKHAETTIEQAENVTEQAENTTVQPQNGNNKIILETSREKQFEFLKKQGFEVVEYYKITPDTILDQIAYFAEKIADYDIPSDGLVLAFEDIAYGKSLGRTAKFPRDSIAFKWADEIKETTLLDIEWSPSRTGLINPVAIFDPVELEGTTVSRASVHNISIMRGLELGIGDKITVYKANMIIPQIAENLTRSSKLEIPRSCPVCGGATKIKAMNEVESLYCLNPECEAKKIKAFTLFVSRDAMNIDGMSEATLEKFIAQGFIHDFSDIYHLEKHREQIIEMEGFGQKSYDNMMESINQSRKTVLPRLVYALGIPGFGVANAKMICKKYKYDLDGLMKATKEDLAEIDGIGEVLARDFESYFAKEQNKELIDKLLKELDLELPEESIKEQKLEGVTFVITGSVEHFNNRNEVKELIESLGGKVTGSVTGKTNYLINNDVTSTSGKNKKAKELGVSIISEQEFLDMIR